MKPSSFQRLSASIAFGFFWGLWLFRCDGAESGTRVPQTAQTTIRERSQQVVASDREFLQRVEAMEKRAEQSERVPPKQVARPSLPPVAEPPRERDDSNRKRAGARGKRAERLSTQDDVPAVVSKSDAVQFVRNYLEAAEGPSPAAEVAHYASDVDYFDHGKVTRAFIGKDQARYYARWPSRDFKLLGEPAVEHASASGATVRFRVAYRLIGKGERAAGQTEEVLRLHRTGSAFRIVGIRERKLD